MQLNKNFDKYDMKAAIRSFSNQIQNGFDIMNSWENKNKYKNIESILILGMGGSAIGADLTKVLVQDYCTISITINRNYTIPKWVNSKTLILACSYSGNTEETLSAFEICLKNQFHIIICTTGGKLLKIANEYNIDYVKIPSGYQPRAALGLSFSVIILLFSKFKFIPNHLINNLYNTISSLNKFSSEFCDLNNSAARIAKVIYNTIPIIYGSDDLTWIIALRLKGQLAENAKILSFHYNFPEQNHNEIEGWNNNNLFEKYSIIWIYDQDIHMNIKKRMDITSQMLGSKIQQIKIKQTGSNKYERLLKLIHYTDWISYYTAYYNNTDPTPVKKIEELKLLLK